MPASAIEHFLEKTIGLDVQSVGVTLVRQAGQKRMDALGMDNDAAYLRLLQNSTDEQKALIDHVVVLETWFFRNHTAFEYLGEYLRRSWLPSAKNKIMRVLVLPCATGEEAYSAAITLLENGLPLERFRIDAVDICERALNKARSGRYGVASFRGQIAQHFRNLYFEQDKHCDLSVEGGYRIQPWLQTSVRFLQGNLLYPDLNLLAPGYDVVFCRNLLIYFTPGARFQAVHNLARLLADDGILFLGHAERSVACEHGFVQIAKAGAFACRKPDSAHVLLPPPKPKRPPSPRQLPTPPLTSPAKITKPAPLPCVKEENKPMAKAQDLLEQAQRLADQGQLQEALRACENCLQTKPDYAPANFLLGVVYQALNQDSQAETYFNKTLYLEPNHVDALNHLAFLVEKRGHSEQAARLRQRLQRLRERDNA
jgi:chemotaxis protein methyltransferase WspC